MYKSLRGCFIASLFLAVCRMSGAQVTFNFDGFSGTAGVGSSFYMAQDDLNATFSHYGSSGSNAGITPNIVLSDIYSDQFNGDFLLDNSYATDENGDPNLISESTLTIKFNRPVEAISFDFITLEGIGGANFPNNPITHPALFYSLDGSSLLSIDPVGSTGNLGFYQGAFPSTASGIFYHNLILKLSGVGPAFGIDNLRVSPQQQVPEPGTLSILVAAGTSLGLLFRRIYR